MSLATVLQGGISIANTVTASLQATVTHKAFSSVDGYGKVTYATGVARTAIVERRQKYVRTANGEEKLSLAKILFLTPVSVDEWDLFTLPDSTEMPILRIGGPVDPTTNAEFIVEIELG
jgi:hypothetical protein